MHERYRRKSLYRLALAPGVVLAAASLIAGCSETFGDKLREHRNCIGEAQIEPAKVDTCLHDTNGRRERIDVCLSSEMVPDRKIEMLNECVEAREHHEGY
jgi:hypothetical protein